MVMVRMPQFAIAPLCVPPNYNVSHTGPNSRQIFMTEMLHNSSGQ